MSIVLAALIIAIAMMLCADFLGNAYFKVHGFHKRYGSDWWEIEKRWEK